MLDSETCCGGNVIGSHPFNSYVHNEMLNPAILFLFVDVLS